MAADRLDAPSTRDVLHRIATHVLGRRRHEVTGRFGLRATPGGFGTPAFGDEPEVLRVAGTSLVRETVDGVSSVPLTGATLGGLSAFVGADIGGDLSVGSDTPERGDTDAPIAVDPAVAAVIAEWFHLGWVVLDAVLSSAPAAAEPAVVQLWPEHFDAGTHVGVTNGERVNLGASPGDAFLDEPYLYVGPWSERRPGDAGYWNAPFGAVLPRGELLATGDPVAAGVVFLETGLGYAAG